MCTRTGQVVREAFNVLGRYDLLNDNYNIAFLNGIVHSSHDLSISGEKEQRCQEHRTGIDTEAVRATVQTWYLELRLPQYISWILTVLELAKIDQTNILSFNLNLFYISFTLHRLFQLFPGGSAKL